MKFELRDWKVGDGESIVKYANNASLARNLRDAFPHPYTLDDAHYFIDQCIHRDKSKQLIKAIVVDGEAVGSVGLYVQGDVSRQSALLGNWLGEPFWGQGIMTQAVKEIIQEGFDTLDIVRIYARPFADNMASRRSLEKAGFILEGISKKGVYKNGIIKDGTVYALLKE